jgi:hypothetical protein
MKSRILILLIVAAALVMYGAALAIPEQPQRPSLALVAPNGGEALQQGSVTEVVWVPMNKVDHYNLLMTSSIGKSWAVVAEGIANDKKSYSWKIVQPLAEGCILKIEAHMPDGTVFEDQSDKPFKIVANPQNMPIAIQPPTPKIDVQPREGNVAQPLTPSLKLVSPNGGEVILKGSPLTIVWTGAAAGGATKLALSTDGGKSWRTLEGDNNKAPEIVDQLTASYVWIVDAPESKTCLIKVAVDDGAGKLREDVSDKPFRIMIERMGDKPGKSKVVKSQPGK